MKKLDIYVCNLNPHHPTEAGKRRPVVILSGLEKGAFIPVAPIGGNADQEGLFRIAVDASDGLRKPSWVVVDQLRAIHRSRLVNKIGHLSAEKGKRLEMGLRVLLQLP